MGVYLRALHSHRISLRPRNASLVVSRASHCRPIQAIVVCFPFSSELKCTKSVLLIHVIISYSNHGRCSSARASNLQMPSSATYSFSSAVFHFSSTTFCYRLLIELSLFIPLKINFYLNFVTPSIGIQGFDSLGPLGL